MPLFRREITIDNVEVKRDIMNQSFCQNPEAHLEPVVLKRKRHYENQSLPDQKKTRKDKGTESERDRLLNKIKKKCRKRMAKLFQKQGEQCQEFDRIWDKKRSDLERDYKLELAIIRHIHGEGTTRRDNKLKFLEDRFEEKKDEHKRLRDVELQKLQADQRAARDEERQKADCWLAAGRACERATDDGQEYVGMHSEEVAHDVPTADYSNPVELSNSTFNNGIDNVDDIGLPVALVNLEVETDEAVVKPSEQTKASWAPHHCILLLPQTSADQIPCDSIPEVVQDIGAPVEEARNTFPFELIDTVNPVQDQSAEVVEKLNASPFEVAASGHVDIITVTQSNVELHNQNAADTSRCEVANLDTIAVACEEPSEKLQNLDASKLQDEATPCVEAANSEAVGVGAPAVQNCEELMLIDVFPSCNQPQSSDVENQSHNLERMSSQTAEIAGDVVVSHESGNQDLHSNQFGIGSESQVNLERISSQTTENTDTVLPSHESTSQLGGNQELQDEATPCVEAANSEAVGVGAPAIQNCEELIDLFPSCNQPQSAGVENQSHNLERMSSQTAGIAGDVVVSHESGNQDLHSNQFGIGSGSHVNLERISSQTTENTDTVLPSLESTSQLGGNQELQSNRFGVASESQVSRVTSVEASTSSRNNVDMSQIVVNAGQLPHHAGLQLASVGNLYGYGNTFSHQQLTSLSSPPLYAAPLQHELGKISKEIEQLQKSYDDMKSRLKSDFEKELQEIIAQINSKYDLKLQEAEADFSHKKNGLDKNRRKVFMNKLLAESFSSACWGDLSWLRGIQQACPSSTMQHQTLQQLVRPPPPPHQPVLGRPITAANIQAVQQQLLLSSTNPTRHSPITTSPVQTPQHAPVFSFGSSSHPLRPPVMSAITPTANSRFGGDVRTPAPHLQFMPTPTYPSTFQQISQPTVQNGPQLQSQPPAQRLNPSLDMADRPNVSGLPQINSSFGSLEQSHLATPRNVQGYRTSSAALDSICISDDD